MNFKTGIMALSMLAATTAGHAQSIARTTHTTTNSKTVSKTISKTINTAITRNGKAASYEEAAKALGQGKLDSIILGQQALLAADTAKVAKKSPTDVKFGMHYFSAENIHGPAGGFSLDVAKKNTTIMLEGDYGRKPGHSIGLIKGHVGYEYPVGSGFSIGGDVGINGKVRRINGNNGGAIAPDAAVSASYKYKSESGFGVNARGRVGGAINFEHDNTVYTHKRSDVIGDLKVGVDYKNVGVNVSGGKDVHKGKYIQAGATYTF